MASSEARSPFVDRMINLLPQGHEEAMKQAFYNIAVISLFSAVGAAAMAVYFILEPFIKPLLWAMLIGSVLHPVKQHSVAFARGWLSDLYMSNTLLVFGILTVPLKAVDFSAQWMGTTIQKNLKLLLSFTLGIPVVIIIQQNYSYSYVCQVYENVVNASYYFSIPNVVTFLTGALGVALTLATNFKLRVMFNFFWIFVFLAFSSLLGSLKVILIGITLVLVSIALAIYLGLIKETLHKAKQSNDDPVEKSTTRKLTNYKMDKHQLEKSNNRYIYGAFWGCVAVQLWRHMWLLHIFPIPLICYAIRSVGSYFNTWIFLQGLKNRLKSSLSTWFVRYKDQIFPLPLQWLFKVRYPDSKFNRKSFINCCILHQLGSCLFGPYINQETHGSSWCCRYRCHHLLCRRFNDTGFSFYGCSGIHHNLMIYLIII